MSARGQLLGLVLMGTTALALGAPAVATPLDSLYALEAPLVDQSGRAARLDRYRGQPVLISMFYASCDSVCPTLIGNLRRVEDSLEPHARARLRVLLISLDPERDTPEVLTALALQHGADLARWSFARSRPQDLRKLAALLGVQYRRLPNREINHSTAISLLDAEGRLLARSQRLGKPEPDFVAQLRAATAASP